jgi:cytochrome P450
MLKWLRQPTKVIAESEARFGPVWGLRLPGGQDWACVTDAELIDLVLHADPTHLHGGEGNEPAIPLQGKNSILVLDEAEHEEKRNLLRPLLQPERVERYEEWMAENCEDEVASWPLNAPFELLFAFERITLRNVIEVVFGARADATQRELVSRMRDLTRWGNNMRNLALQRVSFDYRGRPQNSFIRVLSPVNDLIFGAIRQAQQDPNLEDRDDVLAVMTKARHEDGSPFSEQEIRDNVMTLFLQGHQTTATALAWALERLMRHPNTFARLREEVSSNGDAYLEAVVEETLRIRPPLPQVFRKVHGEPFQLGDFRIEPGVKISPIFYQAQRRPDIYPEPERFLPERFLEEPPPPKAWMPFGGGDRGCIGRTLAMREMKAVLRTVVQRTWLMPTEPADEAIKWRRTQFSPGNGARAVLPERRPVTSPRVGATVRTSADQE